VPSSKELGTVFLLVRIRSSKPCFERAEKENELQQKLLFKLPSHFQFCILHFLLFLRVEASSPVYGNSRLRLPAKRIEQRLMHLPFLRSLRFLLSNLHLHFLCCLGVLLFKNLFRIFTFRQLL
jgi:hypothetical protein